MLLPLVRALVVGFIVAPVATWAQKAPISSDTIYYNATAERLPSRVGAVRGIVTTPTATGGMVQRIYTVKGQQLELIPYADKEGKVRDGVAFSWYASGEPKGRRVYRNGQLDGQLQAYYRDGTLQQLEVYNKGTSKTKLCFEQTGVLVTCPSDDAKRTRVYARYRRGPLLLDEEVSRAIHRLPLPAGSTGERVIVACMVGIDGQIHETRVYKSVGAEYDREAVRVVNNLRWGWTPEVEDNEPVESFYMVNVDFLARR